jgi:hypothetical protein
MKITSLQTVGLLALMPLLSGCFHPSITAVNLTNPKEPEGIPYYLPKPYLIVSKNIRYIPTPTVGLTQTAPIPNSFAPAGTPAAKPAADASSSGAGSGGGSKKTNSTSMATGTTKAAVKPTTGGASGSNSDTAQTGSATGGETSGGGATTNQPQGTLTTPGASQFFGPASIAVVPSAPMPDGLKPETFYTYQIIYLPDLTQKYGLRVKGGVGEMRATLNMVNGWMFTGPGPVYFHDSSTAETVTAYGNAASGFLDSAASFVSSIYGIPSMGGTKAGTSANTLQGESNGIKDYAELWVYEPNVVVDATCVGGKRIEWKLLSAIGSNPTVSLNRDIVSSASEAANPNGSTAAAPADAAPAITKAAAQAIQDLKIADLTASRTTRSGDDFIVVLSRAITDEEKQELLARLSATGVTDFSTPAK